MGRLQVLSKAAVTSRKTYEKTLKKYQSLEEIQQRIQKRLDFAKNSYNIACEEFNDDYTMEQYCEAQSILAIGMQLAKYGEDFGNITIEKVRVLNEDAERLKVVINNILPEGKPIVEELEKLTIKFNNLIQKSAMDCTEEEINETKATLYKHNKLKAQVHDLHIKESEAIFQYNKCKDKVHKLTNKIDEYLELWDKKDSLLKSFCCKYEKDKDKVVSFIKLMMDYHEEMDRYKDRVKLYEDMIDEHLSEMSLVKSKLDVAKDKMEEAEYLYREYRNMISIGA